MKNRTVWEKKVMKGKINMNLIKLRPGQKIPMHKHKSNKYDYIIKGSMVSGKKRYKKGDLVLNKEGSSHSLKAGKKGCDFLVIYR
jgi:anti-sigma factor ChrR (cupin superfamily)